MSADEPKLSAKELKAQRRKAAVAAKSQGSDAPPVTQKKGSDVPVAQKKQGKPDAPKKIISLEKDPETSKPSVALFSHLDHRGPLTSEHLPKDVHPATIALALKYSSRECIGSNSRCIAMLRTFQQVIAEYTVPTNTQTSLQRHLPTYLSSQINFLVQARPLSVSMGSAIRLLKQEISKIDILLHEDQAKQHLITFIEQFMYERITLADQLIVKQASQRIVDGDVVCVYAYSSIVHAVLQETAKHVNFDVVVVDSSPLFEGRKYLPLKCTYTLLTGLSYAFKDVTKVLIGAHTVLANGAVYARAGTAIVAMTAKDRHVPVLVCCETYKFSERVQLDSIVTNEVMHDGTLMYDVTPEAYVSVCISELGVLPTTAIPFASISENVV